MGITLGASHICLGVESVDKASQALNGIKREDLFTQSTKSIAPQKRAFLLNSQNNQQMLYSLASHGIGIEALRHTTQSKILRRSPFLPIFSLPRSENIVKSEYADLLNLNLYKYTLLNLNVEALVLADSNSDQGSVQQIIIFSADVATTVDFLSTGIGGVKSSDSEVKFRSVAGRELIIYVCYDPNPEKPFLDQLGWICMSFDVKNLQHSLKHLHQCGATEIGEPFSFQAGPRQYLISFVRGPSGELYEFLETVRVFR